MKKDSSAHSSSQKQSDNPNNNNNNNNNQQQQPNNTLSNAAAAAQSLQLLLREDTLLVQYELHKQNNNNNDAAFNYAAALLSSSSSSSHSSTSTILQAQQALQEVERKLALAQSLSTKVSRTAPEHVAGPLLVLHGYQSALLNTTTSSSSDEKEEKTENSHSTNNTTLAFIQQRCHRLEKSGLILESTASRVENSLLRNYSRIKCATTKLARVLQLSQTLKLILKLHFETIQLQHYDVDIDTTSTSRNDDLRELIRASKSVCIVEELLQSDELSKNSIEVVRMLQPTCRMTATTVRTAAKSLLEQYHHVNNSSSDLLQLANTLQVYYELQELPAAVWSIVESVLLDLQQEQQQVLWSTSTLQQLFETATNEAKMTMSSSSSDYGSSSAWQRVLQKKLKSARRSATSDWAGIVLQSSLHMFRLHRVLTTKTDTHRQLYNAVVANQSDEMPPEFVEYYENNNDAFSVFTMFWKKWCHDLQDTLSELVASYQDNNKNKSDSPVAAMYPAVRAACLDMLGSLQDAMQIGGSASLLEQQHSSDAAAAALSSTFTGGILGGSAALDEAVWSNIGGGATTTTSSPTTTSSSSYTADTWTRAPLLSEQQDDSSVMIGDSSRLSSISSSTTHHQIIFQSPEYKMLHNVALLPLQQAFTNACRERLVAPLRFMFPEGVAVDEDGIAMSVLPALPSRYDLQKLDANIRTELSLADPREGGGELSMTSMIAEVVVEMVEQFCQRAKGAVSHVGGGGGGGDSSDDDGGYLNPYDLSATEALQHNVKVAGVMSALATSLRNAPENTFVVPYRPATSAQHEEAASMCQIALMPALHEIESMVRSLILTPLCRALNRRVATAIAKLHHGTYLEQSLGEQNSGGGTGTSFVQKHLAGLYDAIAEQHLSKLPPEYASIVASTIATYSIYTFVSNVSLVRPLGETARLHLTQDLADFELALEQLVFKAGSSMSLAQVEKGKPYAELRAVRQMLFWTGLDNKSLSASALAKSILREPWAKDVRPSTVFHFLFSFGPSLLSSPHHSKRMRPEEYVGTLVQLDGSIDDGEASAWMTTMACCDSYQQRESVESGGGSNGGDRRIAAILMMLGPELLRRRRH